MKRTYRQSKMFDYAINTAKKHNATVIVGAGTRGMELLTELAYNHVFIKTIFDNDPLKIGMQEKGITVEKPHLVLSDDILYIVAVDDMYVRSELVLQLINLGIKKEQIMEFSFKDDFSYYQYAKSLSESNYKAEVDGLYEEVFGKKINWLAPKTYNEKLNWEKIYINNTKKTQCADKYLVRNYVREVIGEQYLTKLYGVWEKAEDIDFVALPKSFVLKLNNGSGHNIVVKDKSQLQVVKTIKLLNYWLNLNLFYLTFERQYKDISPRILCEEYLPGVAESIYDYQFYCFNRAVQYIWCINGSHLPNCKASFYNNEWKLQPFAYGYPADTFVHEKPTHFDKMINIAKTLCKEFSHVRIDLYDLPDGRIIFGEMTFTTWAGLMKFVPNEYDEEWGNLLPDYKL